MRLGGSLQRIDLNGKCALFKSAVHMLCKAWWF